MVVAVVVSGAIVAVVMGAVVEGVVVAVVPVVAVVVVIVPVAPFTAAVSSTTDAGVSLFIGGSGVLLVVPLVAGLVVEAVVVMVLSFSSSSLESPAAMGSYAPSTAPSAAVIHVADATPGVVVVLVASVV
jgi:hypothetical protein